MVGLGASPQRLTAKSQQNSAQQTVGFGTIPNPFPAVKTSSDFAPETSSIDMTCFKRIHAMEKIDPVVVADKIEELLDSVNHTSQSSHDIAALRSSVRGAHFRTHVLAVRNTLRAAREEAKISGSFNLFDFSSHKAYIKRSLPLIWDFKKTLDSSRAYDPEIISSLCEAEGQFAYWGQQRMSMAY